MLVETEEECKPGQKTVCVRLNAEDVVDLEIIKALLLHRTKRAIRASSSDAVRYALSICATLSRGECPHEECPYVPQAQPQ